MSAGKAMSNDERCTEDMSLSNEEGEGGGGEDLQQQQQRGMVDCYDEEDGSYSGWSDVTGEKTEKSHDEAANKLRWLYSSRYVVFGILAITSIVVGLQSVRMSKFQVEKNFEQEFEQVAYSIFTESSIHARNVFESFNEISIVATTLVDQQTKSTGIAEENTSSDWPFVTLPNFHEWTKAPWFPSNITLTVLVDPQLRSRWASFSKVTASSWMSDAGMMPNEEEQGPSVRRIFSSEEMDGSDILPEEYVAPDLPASITVTPDENNVTHEVWTWYGGRKVADPMGIAAVNWQSTAPEPTVVNYNTLRTPIFSKAFLELRDHGNPFLAQLIDGGYSTMFQPIFQTLNPTNVRRDLVGFFYSQVSWIQYFEYILQDDVLGVHVVVEDTCGASVATLLLQGPSATVLGSGDLHHQEMNKFMLEGDFGLSEVIGHLATRSGCMYKLRVYPSLEYREDFLAKNEEALSSFPISIALVIVLFGAIGFLLYDWFVRRKQAKILKSAKQSLAIVNSLFPANVRDRMLNNDQHDACSFSISPEDGGNKSLDGNDFEFGKSRQIQKPIADLFPETTIMFADLVGFTAWASQREPAQVFTLLENIYDTFDTIAKKRGVFKVETIGDCYVAVCGLPTPNPNHAVVMASFARRCLDRMLRVVSELEILLGPGTSELGMRFGLHSGPVMAGVLRGDKSRFQLFGDTMNCASRMESTGATNEVHMSADTADLIAQAGKENWLLRREDLVSAKGKGMLQTYWLDLTASKSRPEMNKFTSTRQLLTRQMSVASFGQGFESPAKPLPLTTKDSMERLIDYNVQVLASLLKKIVAMDPSRLLNLGSDDIPRAESSSSANSGMVLDEVAEVIVLPSKPAKYAMDPEQVELPDSVNDQLRRYVSWVASLYQQVPFHSFEHASHVTMSVQKLLSRVVTPDAIDYDRMEYTTKATSSLHEYTYGITSDPLTQFSIAFSAIIHDLAHQGVPNATLIKEGSPIAEKYQNKSVAEQNSVDLAWNMLFDPMYEELRACIYGSQEELNRFRQLVVNVVMATDIVDKDLGAIRKRRWNSVFNPSADDFISEQDAKNGRAPIVIGCPPPSGDVNRKATIVIEHLIQASDVSHTMQHWHIFLKWNQRLFSEMYLAYKTGRSNTDPSENWYASEIGFFDHYIIPLAKKLQECQVFGVASDEYLKYAMQNRKEWERKGRSIVQDYLIEFNAKSTSPLAAAAGRTSTRMLIRRPGSICSTASSFSNV